MPYIWSKIAAYTSRYVGWKALQEVGAAGDF